MASLITESELLEALAAASAGTGPEDARTVQEMLAETGFSAERVRTALKALHVAGRLCVHRVRRTDLSGRAQTVPAYTIAPAKRRGK